MKEMKFYELEEAEIKDLVIEARFTYYKDEEARERDKLAKVYFENVNNYLDGVVAEFDRHPNDFTEDSPEAIDYVNKTEDLIAYKEWLYSDKPIDQTKIERFKWLGEQYGLLYTSDFQIGEVGTTIIHDNLKMENSTFGRGEITVEALAYQLLEEKGGNV